MATAPVFKRCFRGFLMLSEIVCSKFATSDYIVMISYILGVVVLGAAFCVKERNTEDYLLGGRSLPWWAITLSIFVTLFSAISFVAVPEESYTNGLRLWMNSLIGPCLVPLAMWMFLAFYYSLGSFTPYEYIEKRFSPKVRFICSTLFILQRGLYLAIVLFASAKAFEGAVGWKPWFTILAVGILGTLYTTLGGMKAVVWTDVLQFFVLGGGILTAAIFLVCKVDSGFTGIFSYAFENQHGFNIDKSFFSFNPYERSSIWWMVLLAIGATLNYYATDQLVIQRLLSTKTYAQAKRSVFASIPVSICVGSVFWFVGIGLFAYYNQSGENLAADIEPSKVLSYFITTQLPSPIPGLIMAGLLAAIMSTVDSGINSLSAVAVKDIYGRFINKNATEAAQLKVSKYMTVVWGIYMIAAALLIVWISDKAISTIMELSSIWQSVGGIVLGIYILGVTTSRIKVKWLLICSTTAFIALIVGIFKLYYLKPEDQRVSFLIVGNIGLLVTLILGYAGVLLSKFVTHTDYKDEHIGLTLWTIDRSKIH